MDDLAQISAQDQMKTRKKKGSDPRYYLVYVGVIVFILIMLADFLNFW